MTGCSSGRSRCGPASCRISAPIFITEFHNTEFHGARMRMAVASFCRETAVRRRSNHSLTVVALVASLTVRDFASGSGSTRGDRVSRTETSYIRSVIWYRIMRVLMAVLLRSEEHTSELQSLRHL